MDINERKVIVLGDKGMLGQMAVRYFRDRCKELITLPLRYESDTRYVFIEAIRSHPGAIIINAIGKIKQKTDSLQELLWANAVLPLDLANGLLPGQVLIHPSTDCVFSGTDQRPYAVTDTPNATDDYGWSKRLGEVALLGRPNTLISRVSIIGPDWSINPKGLLGWFLSQPAKNKLKGYANHFWNGITTLEWCKQVENYISLWNEKETPCSLIQLGTHEWHTKYDMLRLFQDFFCTDFDIEEFSTTETVDRRLIPEIECKPLRDQLSDLVKYTDCLEN